MDEYVPLTVQWSGYSRLREAPRSVVLDIGTSLGEVKSDRDSDEVVEIVLVDIGRPEVTDTLLSSPAVVGSGVPLMVFDESPQDCSAGGVRLCRDGLQIRLKEGLAAKGVGDKEAIFCFSDLGHLVEFDVRLAADWMAQLRATAQR
ncbi:hypothetical protein [Streptomyces sp. CC219B]|uniref:hypothetical protein n=1 Tax=Streptomyces sp. CC219B TaxID=3044574 RepID=UPI0024A9759C|nr:hypothetical protein [Streptomyces sp. CC219B]